MVTAYPIKKKNKSVDICQAFIKGCNGVIAFDVDKLLPGPSFFYGIDDSNLHLWKQVKLEPFRNSYYSDNSYFDLTRQQYFRITKNRLQHTGYGTSDGKRFNDLSIKIKPWHDKGDHIVVCPQSDSFMRDIIGFSGNWTDEITAGLKAWTNRPIRLREWDRDKGKLAATLGEDLVNAHALVTWSSAAAITALLEGVPVVVGGECAIANFNGQLTRLEELPRKDGRENWAGVLADNQFTLEEMRSGYAWKTLNHV